MQYGQKESGQREEVLRPITTYELKELHRKIKGTLLQLETIMRRLDIPVRS